MSSEYPPCFQAKKRRIAAQKKGRLWRKEINQRRLGGHVRTGFSPINILSGGEVKAKRID